MPASLIESSLKDNEISVNLDPEESSLEIRYKSVNEIKQGLVKQFNEDFKGKEKEKFVRNRLRPNL